MLQTYLYNYNVISATVVAFFVVVAKIGCLLKLNDSKLLWNLSKHIGPNNWINFVIITLFKYVNVHLEQGAEGKLHPSKNN